MKSKSKEPKQIRYYFYMKWAIELRKAGFDIENDNIILTTRTRKSF